MSILSMLLLSALLVCTAVADGLSFSSIGDWGCMGIGGYHANDEVVVAKQFAITSASIDAKFILNTGDNFYYCGVEDKNDAAWNSTFEAIFTEASTMVPWYSCLGNHDYGYPGSAMGQIEYQSPNNNRWILPSRYYYKRLEFPGQVNISLVVLDASPCQKVFRSTDPRGWDPCGSVIPGCPGCTFHQNVIDQSCDNQSAWLASVLPTIPAGDWKIVMSHAPADALDVIDLTSQLQTAGFDIFFNGHVHVLAHYTMDGKGSYVTTGAGCMVKVPARATTDVRQLGNYSSCSKSETAHKCQPIFEQTVAGYTSHTFSDDYTSLTTTFYDYTGATLNTFVTKKGGAPPGPPGPTPPPGPPTPPGPTPPPGPPGTKCCFYKDASCASGDICCSEQGKSYQQSTCLGQYGQKHSCKWTGTDCRVG